MDNQQTLQVILEDLLGSRNVYFQPPENLKMNYPAIKYSINDIDNRYANNSKYSNFTRYNVIMIDELPNNETIKKILNLPYSSFDRHYVANGFNHDSIILYF